MASLNLGRRLVQRERGAELIEFALVLPLLLLPTAAYSQEGTAEIAGVVRDTSGAVLPGVTVEASSDALIEKVRAASIASSVCVPARIR